MDLIDDAAENVRGFARLVCELRNRVVKETNTLSFF